MTSVVEGRGVVEIRNADINKGKACSTWIHSKDWAFILAVGDDDTDEDIFDAVPTTSDHFYTVKVGGEDTKAKYKVASVRGIQDLLRMLVSKDYALCVPKTTEYASVPHSPTVIGGFAVQVPTLYTLPLPLKLNRLSSLDDMMMPPMLYSSRNNNKEEEESCCSSSIPRQSPPLTDRENVLAPRSSFRFFAAT
jgi:hypothetical protein